VPLLRRMRCSFGANHTMAHAHRDVLNIGIVTISQLTGVSCLKLHVFIVVCFPHLNTFECASLVGDGKLC